jgi:hypothetical protein
MKVISGGQTGVDRGALDAALAAGVPCGGWSPQGRLAEDGRIPDRYPLVELAGGGYLERTEANVIDSDATVLIYFGELTGGTAETLRFCLVHGRPFLLLDATELSPARAAVRMAEFAARHGVARLNFAGPRASGEPRAHAFARDAVARLLAT